MNLCEECTVCCTVTRVPELNKAEGVTCEHICDGCNIYIDRPSSCANFECVWLSENLAKELRPDISGAMLESVEGEKITMMLLTGRSVTKAMIDFTIESREDGMSFITTRREVLTANGETRDSIMKKLHKYSQGLK